MLGNHLLHRSFKILCFMSKRNVKAVKEAWKRRVHQSKSYPFNGPLIIIHFYMVSGKKSILIPLVIKIILN